jgi:cell division septal protein FtsQ
METYDPRKSTTDVRQANPRKMNLRVLVFSLIGVVLLLAVVLMIFSNMPAAT